MNTLFLKVVNMSISAGWLVLAVLLLRLLLRNAPKWIMIFLWGVVAIRLVCPFSFESVMSLIPSKETVSPQIMVEQTPTVDTGIPIINNTINPVISGSFSPKPAAAKTPLQIWIPILAAIWAAGAAILATYAVISYWRIRRRVRTSVSLRDNIYQSEAVISPFVLGIIKPKIYLPFHIQEQDAEYVIAHEQAHIHRKDHWWKPLGFLLLTLHWFNALIWLGYILLCRDIELACDEKVVKALDREQRANYSEALLNCSVNRRILAACPLAFGEVGVKGRVKSVLHYKKPAFWLILVALIASIAVAVCFLTDPLSSSGTKTPIPDLSGTDSGTKNPENTSSPESEDLFLDILTADRTFYSASKKQAIRISDYQREIWLYALNDFDSDGKKEVAVMWTDGNILILRQNGNTVTGFDFDLHSMYQLNNDGTYYWSEKTGLTYGCSTLQFSENQCTTTELWRVEHSYFNSVTYYVNNKPVSESNFLANTRRTKISIAWIDWTENPLQSAAD